MISQRGRGGKIQIHLMVTESFGSLLRRILCIITGYIRGIVRPIVAIICIFSGRSCSGIGGSIQTGQIDLRCVRQSQKTVLQLQTQSGRQSKERDRPICGIVIGVISTIAAGAAKGGACNLQK